MAMRTFGCETITPGVHIRVKEGSANRRVGEREMRVPVKRIAISPNPLANTMIEITLSFSIENRSDACLGD